MKVIKLLFLACILCQFSSFADSEVESIPTPEGVAGHYVGSVALSGDHSMEELHDAIILAAKKREWIIKSDMPERIILNLVHRKYDSTLTLDFDLDEVRIFSDSCRIKGKKRKPKDPKGWIKNIKKDIPLYLNLTS
jgi:hypothetical protein